MFCVQFQCAELCWVVGRGLEKLKIFSCSPAMTHRSSTIATVNNLQRSKTYREGNTGKLILPPPIYFYKKNHSYLKFNLHLRIFLTFTHINLYLTRIHQTILRVPFSQDRSFCCVYHVYKTKKAKQNIARFSDVFHCCLNIYMFIRKRKRICVHHYGQKYRPFAFFFRKLFVFIPFPRQNKDTRSFLPKFIYTKELRRVF